MKVMQPRKESKRRRWLLGVLGATAPLLVAWFLSRSIFYWRPQPMSQKEFDALAPAMRSHEWMSADHRFAADTIPVGSASRPEPYWALRIWNLQTGRFRWAPAPAWGPETSIQDVEIAPDQSAIATTALACGEEGQGCDQIGHVYGLRTHRRATLQLQKAEGDVQRLQFAGASRLLVATTRTVYVFDARSGRLQKSLRIGDPIPQRPRSPGLFYLDSAAALTPDGRYYLQTHNLAASVWDVRRERLVRRLPPMPGAASASTMSMSPRYSRCGRVLIYYDWTNPKRTDRRFADALTGRILWSNNYNTDGEPMFTPGDRECLSVGLKTVDVRDTRTGALLRTLPRAEKERTLGGFLSADGTILFTHTGQNPTRRWRQPTF